MELLWRQGAEKLYFNNVSNCEVENWVKVTKIQPAVKTIPVILYTIADILSVCYGNRALKSFILTV